MSNGSLARPLEPKSIHMERDHEADGHPHMEDTPAYAALNAAGLLTTNYRRTDIEDIFTGHDLRANTTQSDNIKARCLRASRGSIDPAALTGPAAHRQRDTPAQTATTAASASHSTRPRTPSSLSRPATSAC